MRKIIWMITGTLLMNSVTHAQQNSKTPRFSSIESVGLLTGQNGSAAIVQTINGITAGNWFTGVGLGIDYYGSRSIPLFIDVRRDIKKAKPLFVYADGGIHFPWATTNQLAAKGYQATTSNGFYFDGGAGLKLRIKNSQSILLSVGYAYKTYVDKAEMFTIWQWPTGENTNDYYRYINRTITLKIGWQL